MQTSVPTLPTALPEVEVIAARSRGTPAAVLSWSVDSSGDTAGDGAVPVRLGPGAQGISDEWLTDVALRGEAGEVQRGPTGSAVRWVAGVGSGGGQRFRTAGAALTRTVNARMAADADAGRRVERTLQLEVPDEVGPDELGALVLGLRLGGYHYKVSGGPAKPRLRTVRLVVPQPDRFAELDAAARRSAVLAEATALARDLANTPSNVKDPAWLATKAQAVAQRVPGVRATVRDHHWLADAGFGGVLAVGGGSVRPPRLVELTWRPRGYQGPRVVLVGKGITFDTGGVSLKPSDGMHWMRTDMSGGAACVAALVAAARLRLNVAVTVLVPCAENHLSGSSYRPGDIVRHYGGRTTEVTNTDAEGRMIMADALAYAVARLRPDVLVDVATLTGAMKRSLGLRTGGVFATDDALAGKVLAAGDAAGESWWRMPLTADVESVHAEFDTAVASEIADVRQCPPGPGGIAAALFLREFTGGLPWAHLDIAGPARAERPYDEVAAGATGFATRTLVELLSSHAT